MRIRRGDVYWLRLPQPGQTDAARHPYVVVQDDCFNASRIDTVVVCGLTTNMSHAKQPGNVLLEAGEAALPRPSVIIVSNIASVGKNQLTEYIGTLPERRVDQVLAGLRQLQRIFEG